MLGAQAPATPEARDELIQKTCVKAILYLSKTTVMSDELSTRL